MSSFSRKLRFAHSALWRRDGLYRASFLLGPAALAGLMVGGSAWLAFRSAMSAGPAPGWAAPRPLMPSVSNSAVLQAAPAAPLPPGIDTATPAGFAQGWNVSTRAITVSPTFDVNVSGVPLAGFRVVGATIDMARLIASGTKAPLYMATSSGLLVARTAGIYAFSVRLDRPAAQTANCLAGFGFGGRRLFSDLSVGLVFEISKAFPTYRFDLKPGLYQLGWGFGCWTNGEVSAPGRLTFVIARPGETALAPAADSDVIVRTP